MVKIKSRNEVLNDILKDAKKEPKNWKAVIGRDNELLSNDYYIVNQRMGIYLIKEYQKNPYEIKGIGGKIARNLDDEIENQLVKNKGDFGIIKGDIVKISKNLKRGIKPDKIFDAALKGNDLGLSIPIKGKSSSSQETYKNLQETLSTKQKSIDSKFGKLASDEGLYDSYG